MEKEIDKENTKLNNKQKVKKEKPAKKKKEGKTPLKNVFCYANIIYTGIAFAGIAAFLLVFPRSEKSDIEQRKLAEFPEFNTEDFLNGNYTGGITEFYDDTVPYRDELKKMGSKLKSFYGFPAEEGRIVGQAVAITTEAEEEPPVGPKPAETSAKPDKPAETTVQTSAKTEAPAETTAQTSAPSEEAVQTTAVHTTTTQEQTTAPAQTEKNLNEIAPGVVTNGQVVTKLSDGHWWAISLFGGGKGTKYAAVLNAFRERLDDSINIYNMVVPTAGEYYLPDAYSSYNASHAASINSINSQLSDGITPVPAIDKLWEHISEPIYTRTDHHWQPLGAYYAAQAFAETANVPFADISTMEKVDIAGYVGTMYSFTESAHLLEDPETFTYYKPTNSYTTYYYDTAYNFDYQLPFFVSMPVSGSYSMFMGGDKKIVRIETDTANGRKLLVFKDSYGNAEIPFYFGSFEEVTVCDMRYFDLDPIQFIKDMGVTDVLFTMCTFSAVGSNANTFASILGVG